MTHSLHKRPLATAEDLLSLPDAVRAEVIHGEIIEKASPTFEHAGAQSVLVATLWPRFGRRGGGEGPAGWWLRTEVDVQLDTHDIYRPDLAGWRRERVPEAPRGRPVLVRPDWVCEVLSPTNAENDLSKKFRVFQRCGVPHYWIVDPEHEHLTVYRWTDAGYLVALQAGRSETVRAEPFEALEFRVGMLFDESVDDPGSAPAASGR